MAFTVSDAEIEALQGQAHMNYLIYFYLRRFMDYATGVTGVRRRVSYQAISEAIEIEPREGVKALKFHKSTIRRAIFQLEKSGLLVAKSLERQLIFLLPLASTHNSVKIKADTKPTQEADTLEAAPMLVSSTKADIPKTVKADIHLLSGNTNIPPPPITSLHSSDSETSQAVAVEFSNSIKIETQAAILHCLSHIKDHEIKQTVVDDLIGYCSQQQAKGRPVNNPVGVIRRIMERVSAGEYVPDLAHFGRQIRANERRANARMIPSENSPKKPPSEKQLADFREVRKKLKKA
jgi:hypothetical protein